MRDKHGSILRAVKLNDEMMNLIKKEKLRFKEVFGRFPTHPRDRLFIAGYLYSEDEFHDATMEVADAIGVRPEVKYATDVTRRIITDDNVRRLTDAELAEWENAIETYQELEEQGRDPFAELYPVPDGFIERTADLLRQLDYTICHIASFLEKVPRNRRMSAPAFLQYYYAARSLDTIRTMRHLFSARYSDDVLSLVRTVYESYLRILLLRKHPETADDFIAVYGVTIGTHEFEKGRGGKANRRRIVDRQTGKKFEPQISNKRMAKSSDDPKDLEFFEAFYPFLSTQVHGALDRHLSYVSEAEGFKIHRDHDPYHGLLIASLINAMLLCELSKIGHISKIVRRDLGFMASTLRRSLLTLTQEFYELGSDQYLRNLISDRAKRIRP